MNWLPRPAEGTAHVAPSLLAADFTVLAGEIADVEKSGADLLHLDVMDGHFVPNLTFGPFIVDAIRRCTGLPLDTHLMLVHPDRYLEQFIAAGSDALTIHAESAADPAAALAEIRRLGARPGISLNPPTALDAVIPHLPAVDLVLVMTVMPGFGGQKFDPAGPGKIRELARIRSAEGLEFLISVDGGINPGTGAACREAGADILVSGSWLFQASDRAAAIRTLRG